MITTTKTTVTNITTLLLLLLLLLLLPEKTKISEFFSADIFTWRCAKFGWVSSAKGYKITKTSQAVVILNEICQFWQQQQRILLSLIGKRLSGNFSSPIAMHAVPITCNCNKWIYELAGLITSTLLLGFIASVSKYLNKQQPFLNARSTRHWEFPTMHLFRSWLLVLITQKPFRSIFPIENALRQFHKEITFFGNLH